METPHLSLLLLYRDDVQGAQTVRHHIDALASLSSHRVYRLPVERHLPRKLSLDRFDGVIIHYSLMASLDSFLDAEAERQIAAYRGVKAVFIQDEHRHVQRTVSLLRRLGINLLFTCVPASEVEKVYPRAALPGLRKETVLTGYVAPELCRLTVEPLARRPIDVGYRARKLSVWLGQLGQEKWLIGQRFAAAAPAYNLVCDISHREEDRLYGQDWIDFLMGCKAVLGSESGSSVFDMTGEIEKAVVRHELEVGNASFETLRDLYFRDEDGRIANAQISPRCFEAAALRTLMILYEGNYSGILVPWRHYVPLKKDHSNMAEVVAVLRDPPRAQAIVDTAYQEIALNPAYSFASHVLRIDTILSEEVGAQTRRTAYTAAEWAEIAQGGFGLHLHRLKRRAKLMCYRLLFAGLLGGLPADRRDAIHRRLKRFLQGWSRSAPS